LTFKFVITIIFAMKFFLVILLFFIGGCEKKETGWIPILSDQKWYQNIKTKEKRLSGKIFDKGLTKWIIKGDVKEEKGIMPDDIGIHKRGEEYNRFLFETSLTIYELYLGDFWGEEKLKKILGLDVPEEAKKLGRKKVEVVGKERAVSFKEGGKILKRRELLPGMIRIK